MKRIIAHWTAGSYNVSDLDKEHYHFIISGNTDVVAGKFPVSANEAPKKGAYAAHTLNCNTGSIGVSVACMAGAVEGKSNGQFPMKETQFERMCRHIAELSLQYNIPVTPTTILSHAEVQPNLKITQRGKWDITVLPFKPDIKGAAACGAYMRARVTQYRNDLLAVRASMQKKSQPTAQNFIGGAIGGVIVDRILDKVLDRTLDKVAESPNISLDRADVPVVREAIRDTVAQEVKSRVDHVTDNEPFYKSRSMWGQFFSAMGAAQVIYNLWFDGLPNSFEDYQPALLIFAGIASTLWARYGAKKPLGE